MKKILFFIESLGGGGAERVLYDIVSNIDRKKFSVIVKTVSDEGKYDEKIKKICTYKTLLRKSDYNSNGIKRYIYILKHWCIYHFPPNISYRLFVREKVDTEVGFVEGFATKIISKKNTSCRKIAWVHVNPLERAYADKSFKNLEEQKQVYAVFDKIVCVSKSVKEGLEKKINQNKNVMVIYNPVNSEEIVKLASEHTDPKSESVIRFVSIGRLEEQKGYDRLIDAFALVSKKGYAFQLEIIGEGSQFENLKDKIQKYKLENKIFLRGYLDNPYKYVADSDVFVCSSRAEGYSLVIAEAMVLGIPILTTNCSGPNELVDYGKYGIMTENTTQGIYEGIVQILDNPQILQKYAKLSLKKAETINLEKTIRKIEKVL